MTVRSRRKSIMRFYSRECPDVRRILRKRFRAQSADAIRNERFDDLGRPRNTGGMVTH